jgi:putative Mn2+ efflux pump MntP
MELITIITIAIGLAMDSFAVSIAGGVSLKDFRLVDALRTALFMGVAQALFFAVGYFIASTVSTIVQSWDHWLAFGLLMAIGLKMVFEHHNEEKFIDIKSVKVLTTLAVATSIDALAVGISFSILDYDVVETASIIGIASFILAGIGVYLGVFVSKSRSFPSDLIGGLLLIGIGVRILIVHITQHI